VIDSRDDDPADFAPATFDNLYARHARGLTRYVARRVRNHEATVKIVGKIWDATLVRFAKEPHPKDWNKFIWGIAKNKIADWARSSGSKPDPIYLDPVDLERVAGEVVEESGLESLKCVDEMTYPEMANVMGVSKSTVKKHVERGIRNARVSMARAGFFVRATQEVK
jgi:DNA-directed RNA polymerase specialized sigma24 family protein